MDHLTEATKPGHDQDLTAHGGRGIAPLEDATERIIVPAKRRLRVRDLPGQVPVVRVLAARDFKAKYKQALLGPLWLIVQPLALLAGFLVAFHGLGKVQVGREPYVVFTLVGLSVWAYFQAALTLGTASIVGNGQFIRFTPVPRPAFPLAAMIASLPSLGVTGAAAVLAAALTGHLSPRVVLLPVGIAWLMLLTAGIVAILSSLAARFRDVLSVLPVLLQVGVFFAPIGYSLARLSPGVRAVVELNPITGLIEFWRWILLAGFVPQLTAVLVSLLLTGLLLVAGWLIFTRLETTMADVI
jgi:ABC-type polysaccharide/polyol phosphate export permease